MVKSVGKTGERGDLAQFLMARVPADDAAAFGKDEVAQLSELALAAVRRHRRGTHVVSIEPRSTVERDGRPTSVITVVNDNMPFLFDSVTGEVTETLGEPFLVMHPVLVVKHGKTGVSEIVGEAAPGRGNADADRVSLIQIVASALTAERADDLARRLQTILDQVEGAVRDWKPMLARLDQAILNYRYTETPLARHARDEAIAFLEWLRDDNFTFLGMREYRYRGSETTGTLDRTDEPGLGILADPSVRVLRVGTEAVTTTPEIRTFLHGPDALIVTKANTKSVVHRRAYLDYVGVKTFDARGKLLGELRIVGLFTSSAYTRSVMTIPYVRSKVEGVIAKSGFDPADHSGKALINVLESFPRDELFQISVPQLRKFAEAILALGERPRVRVLARPDRFDRFVSVLVYVPRDRYDSRVRERIGDYLKTVFAGRISAYYPSFPEGGLARVHFIIGRSGGKTPKVEARELEDSVRDIVRTWEDTLGHTAADLGIDQRFAAIAAGFPEGYRHSFTASDALGDATRVAAISADNPIIVDFRRRAGQAETAASLMIYHHAEAVSLSRRVPLLENMGFRVISERTFEASAGDAPIFVHDMEVESEGGRPIDLTDDGELLESVFLATWNGVSENDAYAGLVQTARLGAPEIDVLRAYGRYLQQAGIPQSQDFVAGVLNRYPEIARALHRLFEARFDPALEEDPAVLTRHLKAAIRDALDSVPNLDDDTILRRYQNLIDSSLRTNAYIPDRATKGMVLAIKLDASKVDGLPSPRPWREIFVYGVEVEGVHLRFGPVARGGLRWSDRAQDYRTEVLGLVKAQQVKNAVIVPVGAKGGFYPKQLPRGGGRDAVFEAGRQAYVTFVTSLLSVTDNLKGEAVVPPAGVLRHDGDDPYFVVAADKGTATFSDTANAISQGLDFWLDDAFASGGSAGYDHKKMGITARGAWEAVKRHFREMDRDIQREPFTVVGVGDMSGDVFGNGMLLSPEIRLLAAFDHRDIFIDPKPDPAASLAERQRLYDMPRSSWQDYDKTKLLQGGIVVSRAAKSVTLSAEAAEAIGLGKTTTTPAEIMSAILRAPVDLLWFGGIGTYVRASSESNADVGDKSNDLIRVAAEELGAKVVGEGANLGMTQRARIEYGLKGGRCNSDAVDNSAGVNCSDVEVNIKIALAAAMREGSLKRPARDRLLAQMTDEVAELVLANNYRQTLSISLVERRGAGDLATQTRFIENLESRKLLDRQVETLPSDKVLQDRVSRGEGLTRAEIGVLVAYAKLVLFDDLIASDVPDDPHLVDDLLDYFPSRMRTKYSGQIRAHRLRREIIATRIANEIVNLAGPTYVSRLQDMTGCTVADTARAFITVRDGFALRDTIAAVDALDGKVDGKAQLEFYGWIARLIHSTSIWIVRNGDRTAKLDDQVADLLTARKAVEPKLAGYLPGIVAENYEQRRHGFRTAGAPEDLAERLALYGVADLIPDIALAARKAEASLDVAARALFAVTENFRLGRIEEAARQIAPGDYYDGLALARARDQIDHSRRSMTVAALKTFGKADDPVAAWLEAGGQRVGETRSRLTTLVDSGDLTVSRLTIASGLLADLAHA